MRQMHLGQASCSPMAGQNWPRPGFAMHDKGFSPAAYGNRAASRAAPGWSAWADNPPTVQIRARTGTSGRNGDQPRPIHQAATERAGPPGSRRSAPCIAARQVFARVVPLMRPASHMPLADRITALLRISLSDLERSTSATNSMLILSGAFLPGDQVAGFRIDQIGVRQGDARRRVGHRRIDIDLEGNRRLRRTRLASM